MTDVVLDHTRKPLSLTQLILVWKPNLIFVIGILSWLSLHLFSANTIKRCMLLYYSLLCSAAVYYLGYVLSTGPLKG